MKYYTNNSSIIINENDFINEGTQGKIYRLNDSTCAKIYKEDALTYDKEIFMMFKDLSLAGYCILYDLLKTSPNSKAMIGYTMKYYQENVKNILLMPTEYTLESFKSLIESVLLLANNKVLAKDTIPVNSIMTNEGVILIDFDACRKTDIPKEDIQEVNVSNILYLFKKIFARDLIKLGIPIDEKLELWLDEIFSYSKNPVEKLNNTFSYVKKPYDLLPFQYRY